MQIKSEFNSENARQIYQNARKCIHKKDLDNYEVFSRYLWCWILSQSYQGYSYIYINNSSKFYFEWSALGAWDEDIKDRYVLTGSKRTLPDLKDFFKRFAKENKMDLEISQYDQGYNLSWK